MINAIAKRIANYVCYNTESSDDKLYNYEIYPIILLAAHGDL